MGRTVRIVVIIAAFVAGFALLAQPAAAVQCYFHSFDVGYVCDSEPAPQSYVEPQPFADSILEKGWYARIKDLSNVYPQPTTAVAPVRNVGDGYIFASIRTEVTNEQGETWYMINYNEYVRAEDLTFATVSDFAGVQVLSQPERPFGWMIVDYWYSYEPGKGDEEPLPGTVKLPRYTLFEAYDAVEAEDGWIWYNIGNGRWMKQTYVSLIDPVARPEGVGENDYWVEVDLYEQSFAAYEGDRMVYAGLVSSGLNRWPTNEGLFQVWDRHLMTKMSGAEGKVDYYFIEDVPHTMYFDGDIALHGAFWHDRFGYKHSHGCVNMPPRAAEWVYNWSADAPNDLYVWVHTSDPTHYFHRYDPVETFAGP